MYKRGGKREGEVFLFYPFVMGGEGKGTRGGDGFKTFSFPVNWEGEGREAISTLRGVDWKGGGGGIRKKGGGSLRKNTPLLSLSLLGKKGKEGFLLTFLASRRG